MKQLSLGGLLLSLSTFLLPIKGLLITMFIFVLLDTATGIYVTIKKNGIESLSSNKFFNIVVKLFFYLSTIIMAYFVDINILEGKLMDISWFVSKAVTCIWIYNEIKSMDENSQKLGNKSIWKIVQEMIDRGKGMKKDLNEIKE